MATKALDARTLDTLISAAVAAPSIHNSQPWRYRLDPDTRTIEVYAVPGRRLPHTDPDGRALHLSVGAAVLNLRVAVAHFGWTPVVRLLPRPADPDHLASVRLAGRPPGGDAFEENLYEALWRRHSSRFPFSDRPVPVRLVDDLAGAAAREGARLIRPSPAETSRILELTAEAAWYESADAQRRVESRSWIRDEGSDGVPASALGPRDEAGRMPVRDFSAPPSAHRPDPAAFESHPVVTVLSTARDTPEEWLRAGQALERTLLLATAHDLRASLLHQALEWDDLRWALNDPRGGIGHVQMLIRLGYGPEGPPTSRLPVRDVLEPPRWPA